MEDIKIKDESGDRKYFTQLPNIILNHSTANDQALYLQMKRYAGEDGQCFATQETLRKKLGIGKQAYNKSLKYLLDKKWIKFIGLTNGKTRPIKTYSIVDIWKINIMEYEKISPETAVSFTGENEKISPETDGDKSQNGSKISPRMAIEEEPLLRRTIKKNSNAGVAGDIPKIINLFKDISPNSYQGWFGNKTERSAAEKLLEKYPIENYENLMVNFLPKLNVMPYVGKDSKAFKPSELLRNLDKIITKLKELQLKADKSKNIIGIA